MSEKTFDNVKITSSFDVPENRENLVSGETIGQHFGKIAKVIEDLENGEFNSGASIDDTSTTAIDKTWSAKKISESIPTSLPANGGNAATVNNHTVNADVPADAKFTDTTNSDIVINGNPVVMDGLQGGVPFSEITIEGKNIFDGSLTIGMVSTGNGTIVASKKYISTTNLISVKPNTRYIAQNSENKTLDAVVYFDKNKSVIGHTYTSAAGFNSFTTPDKCSFIMWRYLFDTDQDDTSALTNIQLEEGDSTTSYEPPITGRELTLNVNGTEYKLTPDSNPYTVPTDIRQLEGRNTLSITNDDATKLNVTGVASNKVVEKIWDEFEKFDDSAYTGNAKTLNGKSNSDFAVYQSVSDSNIDTITESGLYRITSSAGLLLHITWDTNYMLQIRNVNGGRLSWRTKAGTWGAWSDVADGGNASKVDGKPVSDLALAEDNYWLYTYAANNNKHGAAHRIKATHNVKSDNRFCLQCESGEGVRVDFATDADTLDGYHAADLIASAASSGYVIGAVVTNGTKQTVTLGFQPSAVLCIGSAISNISGIPRIQNSLIINNDTLKELQCGCVINSEGSIQPSFTLVDIKRTSTGFTVQAPSRTYITPPAIDYIAFK